MTKELKDIRDALEGLINQYAESYPNVVAAADRGIIPDKIYDDAKQALSTLDSIMAGGGWQDISTAPKDEFVKIRTHYYDATAFFDTADSDWFFERVDKKYYSRVANEITHWMPLPAAPKHGGGLDNQTPRYGNYNGETK